MREQRLVFGSVAEAYEAHRPGYPDGLFDDLLARAPVDPFALDIGCGTGKVAGALAARGVRGIGVEPDADMAAIASRRLDATPWTIQVSDFEACDATPASVDLITCGQAWHWIHPERGLAKAATVLRPGGWLNLFWNRGEWPDAELRAAIDGVYQRHAPQMASSLAQQGKAPKGGPPSEERLPDAFAETRVAEFVHTIRYTAAAWIALLGTHSDHVLLDPEVREALYADEAAVIESFGGEMEVRYRVELWAGRRA